MVELKKQKTVSELYEYYAQDIQRYAFSILRSIEDSKDAAQEVFLKYQTFEDKFKEQCSYKTWLFTIARNICYNKLNESRNKNISLDKVKFHSTNEKNIDDLITLNDALKKISPSENEIIYLRDFAGYSYSEIAVLLDISLDNVKVKLFRTKKKLKQLVEG